MCCGCYEILSERPFLVLLAEKYGAVVPMTFRRIMQTSPPTFVNASLSLIVPLCYLMHGFRRWKEMRQHQNTNNKVVDNGKGGGRHNKHCLGLLCLAQPKVRGANERETKREREYQSSFVSRVLSEVRRTKREKVFRDEPLCYAEEWAMLGDNDCSAICTSSWCVNKKKKLSEKYSSPVLTYLRRTRLVLLYTHTGWKKGK